MSKLWRALVLSAVATGVVAVAMQLFSTTSSDSSNTAPKGAGGDGSLVEADHLTDEEKDLLVEELIRQV